MKYNVMLLYNTMGSTFSRCYQPSKEDYLHLKWVKQECRINLFNTTFMRKIFIQEWNTLCDKWDKGTLCGYHFKPCTYIVERLFDIQLTMLYDTFVSVWNTGKLVNSDFMVIHSYIRQIE